jgi:hypothetical protein
MSVTGDGDTGIGSWLRSQAPVHASETVWPAALERIRATRQRRPVWGLGRLASMTAAPQVVMATAALAGMLIVGMWLTVGRDRVAAPDASSAPAQASPESSPAASERVPPPSSASLSGTGQWTGPVRASSGAPASEEEISYRRYQSRPEPGDAAPDYVDIEQVLVDLNAVREQWVLRLVAMPPNASTIDSTQTVISYGLAFETTGDEVPDYVVGISNDATVNGEYRVWVTTLATGETQEQDGPPYGWPLEFVHPDETIEDAPLPEVRLWFLWDRARPEEFPPRPRFYAWASLEENGEVVSWDYAPDHGWVGPPPD